MTLKSLRFQVSKEKPTSAVILCHGFGAPGDDLFSLASHLTGAHTAMANTCFVFPEAPVSLGDAYGREARAWWNIDFDALQKAQHGDPAALKEFRDKEPAGLARARALLTDLVSQLSHELNLPFSKIVLGGFSQGAMLATDVSLRLGELTAGLVILSGTLITAPEWKRLIKDKTSLSVFQSHGKSDAVLSYAAAKTLEALFTEVHVKHEFHSFAGGHGIPPEVLDALGNFLAKSFKK
jgi:phospholipase/carboxylesterase